MATPPSRPKLRARYDARQQQVILNAAAAFARDGYHATSMADLTAATGLAAGGLYHYIGSKEQLLIRICDQLMDPLLEVAYTIAESDDDPETQLRALVGAWVAHVIEHRNHMIVFQQERHVIEREPLWRAVRESRKQFEKVLDGVLERAALASALSFPDRRLALLALLGMVNHIPQWYRPRGRLSAHTIADGFCELLLTSR
jgi:TetR/AcrR family transcriptional regulator, cholesterol catabolism regulator